MLELNKAYKGNVLELIKNIPNESIDLVITDPPYKIVAGGVSAKSNTGGILKREFKSDGTKIGNKWLKKDGTAPCAVKQGKMFKHNDIKFSEWLPEVYRVLKKGTHAYIMINSRNLKELQIEAEKVGFVFQNLLVWKKQNATPNQFYMQSCEFILLLSKRPAKKINNRGDINIFFDENPIGKKEHPSQKPPSLVRKFIENSSNINDIVLDPFAGSGATAMACIQTNRNFITFEIDEEYYKLIKENIKKANCNVGLFAN